MKKVIYIVLACIIIAGGVIIYTSGLNVDILYSKNAQIDVYIGKEVNTEDIRGIAKEVFPNERVIVQNIELYNDMVSITVPEKSDNDLKSQLEDLNKKINEKYGTKNKVSDIKVTHNPKIKLSSIVKPYLIPLAISFGVVLVFVAVRYKKLGIIKTLICYILSVAVAEATLLSLIAITRLPINRAVIPVALVLYVAMIIALGLKNEKKLEEIKEENK